MLRESGMHLAACDLEGEGPPRLTSGCQDEGVINARREEKSTGGTHSARISMNNNI